jgi:hypothetical protein
MLLDDATAIECEYPSINQGESGKRWFRIKTALAEAGQQRPTPAMPKPPPDCGGCRNFRRGRRWGMNCTECIRNTDRLVDNYSVAASA